MERKLYVGNLPYKATKESLTESFAQAGGVEDVILISDRMTGRSKGFGFVTMATEDDAQAAINMWNGKEYEGRKLIVNEARPQKER